MGKLDFTWLRSRLTTRNALMVMLACLTAFAPAGALAMGQCPAMNADCHGPCANYGSLPTMAPLVQALPEVGDVAPSSIDRVPAVLFGSPDPPPRPFLSV